MHKVTVIIPTFNRAKLLKRAMESVYAQTYRPIELIVINNASTDETDDLADQFKSKNDDTFELIYIKQTKNDRNGARNMAIQMATGDFICFLDDDDEFLNEKLAKQINHFEANPKMDVSFTNNLVETNGRTRACKEFKKKGIKHDNKSIIQRLCTKNFIPITNVMIRTPILKKNRFNPYLLTHEDYELWLRLIQDYNFDWIDEPLSLVHSSGFTNDRYNQSEVLLDRINILFKYLPSFPQNFIEMIIKLKRLKELLIEQYKNENELTKLADFELSFRKHANEAMTRQMYWIKQSERGVLKYIKMFRLDRLRNELGLSR